MVITINTHRVFICARHAKRVFQAYCILTKIWQIILLALFYIWENGNSESLSNLLIVIKITIIPVHKTNIKYLENVLHVFYLLILISRFLSPNFTVVHIFVEEQRKKVIYQIPLASNRTNNRKYSIYTW